MSNCCGGLLGLGVFGWIIILLLAPALLILWIWMLADCISRDFSNPSDRTLWLTFMILSFFLGFAGIVAIVYFFAIYRGYKKKLPNSERAIVKREKLLKK